VQEKVSEFCGDMLYARVMAIKSASIPIRIERETLARVDAAARTIGIPRSTLIRMLVERFVETYEENGERITMPIRVLGADAPEASLSIAAEKEARYGKK